MKINHESDLNGAVEMCLNKNNIFSPLISLFRLGGGGDLLFIVKRLPKSLVSFQIGIMHKGCVVVLFNVFLLRFKSLETPCGNAT